MEVQSDNRLAKKEKPKVSLPTDIIEEILSRLPVKFILRFRTVSKPWLSRISHPSFTKLHFTRATTALFIAGHDNSTHKLYFFSAGRDGGPLTHLMTLDDFYSSHLSPPYSAAKHLNGLVFFTRKRYVRGYIVAHAFVVNPSTRNIFELPIRDPESLTVYHEGVLPSCYYFGFDESTNEHKILMISRPSKPEVMIFCMSNYSWKKIDVEPPVGYSWDRLSYDVDFNGSVCVDSVMHIMFLKSCDILALDFRTEKFSIITTPKRIVDAKFIKWYFRNGVANWDCYNARLMKINGCVAVVCYDRIADNNEICIRILQDYANRVWVRETIKFPDPGIKFDDLSRLSLDANMDDIIFSQTSEVTRNVMRVPIYNKKTGCLKSLEFTLGHQFLCRETMRFNQIRCYTESIVSL